MKLSRKLVLGIVALSALGATNIFAQDVSVSIDSGFVNQYVWRGQKLNGSVSWEPGVTVGYGPVSLSSWSNFSTVGPNGRSWTEHDFTLDYSPSLGDSGVTLSMGWINYAFPDIPQGGGRYTNELYVGVSHDDILAPSFTAYGDVHEGDGMYYLFGIGPSFEIGKGVTVDTGASIGINQKQWWDETGVSDVNLTIGLTFPYKNASFSPFFTAVLSPDKFAEAFGVDNYQPVYGASVSFSF